MSILALSYKGGYYSLLNSNFKRTNFEKAYILNQHNLMSTIKNYFVYVFLLMLISPFSLIAQNKSSIYLSIKNRNTNEGISNVNVIVKNNYFGTSSTANGFCEIITYTLPITLQFSHVSFNDKILKVREGDIKDTIIIYLEPKQVLLDQIQISAKRETVFKQPKYSIMDFNFIDDQLLILEYNKATLKDFRLLLTDSFFEVNTIYNIPRGIKPTSIFKDCLEYCHLLTEDSAYQISYSDSLLSLHYPMEIGKFHSVMDDCLFKIDSNLFIQNKYRNGYSYDFYTINLNTKEPNPFISSNDFDRIQALREEIEFYIKHPPACQIEFAIRFEKEMMLPPFNQYLSLLKDSIVYFNHQNSSIDVFSKNCEFIRSTSIHYHLSNGWTSELLFDKTQGKVYTIIKNTLYEINLSSGEITPKTKILLYEKILINNGYGYVLKKKLYTNQTETYIDKIHL